MSSSQIDNDSSSSRSRGPTLDDAQSSSSRNRLLSRTASRLLVLPQRVRVRNLFFVPLTICLIVVIIATVEHLRTFVIEERALLTQRGRQRNRSRRRKIRKTRHCDESDEPNKFFFYYFNTGWRRLSSCVEYDLSLRRSPLGDSGVWRLVGQLGRKEYATMNKHRRVGQLKVLNLERQQITRRGAGYLARWLSADPIVDSSSSSGDGVDNNNNNVVVDVYSVPTAASRSLFINLEGNPIGPQGVKQLERAVDKARLNGISVVIVGGGNSADIPAGGNADHIVRLGPISYTRRSIDMPPWRLPVPFLQRVMKATKNNLVLPIAHVLVICGIGLVMGWTSSFISLPYRFRIIRNTTTERR